MLNGGAATGSQGGERVALFDNAYCSTLAFLLSLGRRGIPVDVYGPYRIGVTRWSRYAASYRQCPPLDRVEIFLPWLREQIRSTAITRVAATTDLLAYYLSVLRDEFSPAVRATIPMLHEVEHCLIKSRFATVCASLGIATPEAAAPANVDAALEFAKRVGYPLVLKAKSHLAVGMAARGAIVRNAAQLRREFRPYTMVPGHETIAARYPELRLPLLQRFVPSATRRVYSVSGFKHAERGIITAALSYKGEQWPLHVGVSTYQVGCNDPHILRAGIDAADRLVGCGIFELELLADGDELLAIDLNPRGFGFMQLDIARGSDLPWLWFQSSLGQIPECAALSELPPVECRQPIPYYLSRAMGLLSGPNRGDRLRRLAQELRRPWISMTGPWSDPIPKLLAYISWLRHPGSLLRADWGNQAARGSPGSTAVSHREGKFRRKAIRESSP